jgi:four helix bundle protein
MRFEDLNAWRVARELVSAAYELGRYCGLARDYGLKDQLQRAAVSVMTNIAEGFERVSSSEKLQFYNIARASCGEVRSLLYVVEDVFPDSAKGVDRARALSNDAGRLISGLMSSTQKRKA